jgi:hypothetical protein
MGRKWRRRELNPRNVPAALAAARQFGVSESQAHNLVKGYQRRYAGGPIREAA